jgi:hypothetical protein
MMMITNSSVVFAGYGLA